MTKNEREEIVCCIAQEIISPLAFDEHPAKEVCKFMSQFVKDVENNEKK